MFEADAPDGTTAYQWDTAPNGVGKLASAKSPDQVMIAYGYDTLSRASQTTWSWNGESFAVGTSYDAFGRIDTRTYPAIPGASALVVNHTYSASGALVEVANNATGKVYWRRGDSDASDVFGHEIFGNGVDTQTIADPARPTVLSAFRQHSSRACGA